MGWIRELMRRAEAPPRSMGELSRRCLAHPAWPEEPRPKPRSLAAMLGRMDRGLDLDWLRDRPAVQQVLAEVLTTALADVQLSCRPPDAGYGAPADPSLRLDDLPFARSLRLRDEALPPGIPLLPQRVSAWSAVWWYAPSGSGRSLVGRWLEARGAARWVSARHWPEAEPECHEPGPVFVELHSPKHGEALSQGAPRSNICVAAPFLPESSDWVIVRSPPVLSYLDQLIAWVIERLPSDSRLSADAATKWLAAMPSERGVLDSLGAAIGLLGLLDELGIDQLRGRTLAQLARAAIRFRTASSVGEHQLLREQGFELLTSIAVHCLTESDEALDLPRSEGEWQSLVPPELARGVDVEWVKASLQRAGAPITTRDLERAALRLPPGAYRIIRQLASGGFLRANEPGERLALAPRWLGNAALSRAVRQLLSGPAHEWGEALLVPESATVLLGALEQALLRDAEPLVDRVLELEARGSPAYAAGVEALVRVIGTTPELLSELSTDLLASLYQEQVELAVRPPEHPSLPLVEYPEEVTRRCPILMRGAWYYALWSIAERLPRRSRSGDLTLNPWHDQPPALGALDDIAAWLARAQHAPVQELLFRLLERQTSARATPHRLERAALAVRAFRATTLQASDLAPWSSELFCSIQGGLRGDPTEFAGLLRAALPLWLEHLTTHPQDEQPSGDQHWLDARAQAAALIWPQLGPAELGLLLAERRLFASELRVPWQLLSREQWASVAELWQLAAPGPVADHPSSPSTRVVGAQRGAMLGSERMLDSERMLSQIPEEVIASSLAGGGRARAYPQPALARTWGASQASLLRTLAARLDAASGDPVSGRELLFDACWLLDAEPPSSEGAGLELLSARLGTLELTEALLTPVLLHLQRRVRVRGVGWRSAYQQLAALESRRRRLEHGSS